MSNLIRKAQLDDLPQIKDIYNESVLHSIATFDLHPCDDADRLAWFQAHQGKYLLLVYETDGVIAGYASLSRYRERPAFDGAAEISIYLHETFGFSLCGVIHKCGKKFGRYLDLSIYQIIF